jgi:hypothetical protein
MPARLGIQVRVVSTVGDRVQVEGVGSLDDMVGVLQLEREDGDKHIGTLGQMCYLPSTTETPATYTILAGVSFEFLQAFIGTLSSAHPPKYFLASVDGLDRKVKGASYLYTWPEANPRRKLTVAQIQWATDWTEPMTPV